MVRECVVDRIVVAAFEVRNPRTECLWHSDHINTAILTLGETKREYIYHKRIESKPTF
jgi:hypothetical protein